MAGRYDNKKVIERRSNGACVTERVCNNCQKAFVGERNTCSQCRTKERRLKRKFGPVYQKQYYRRKISILHDKGLLSRNRHVVAVRKAALRKQRNRIREEMAVIKRAGFDPDRTPLCKRLDAGVQLDSFE